jgi:hypothetical protein
MTHVCLVYAWPMAHLLAAALGSVFVLMQAGNPIVEPPPLAPPQNPTVVNNTTNVFPPPDPALVVETEKKAAPVVLQSGLQALDASGGESIGEVFKLGLALGQVRKDLILLPVVQDLNQAMQRAVLGTLALVVAALCLWGLLGQVFGSDAAEAFEYLGRAPLWCVLALTSLQWYGLMLDAFAALGGVIASAGGAAFGPTLRPDFWSDAGLGLFAVFVGVFYLLNLLLFALQMFANTAFLGYCAVVAPIFVFLKTTPWTAHWGDNWFRMVPGTAGDLLAMLSLLAIGAAGLDRVTAGSAFATLGFDLGLLLTLPLIRRLFGLEGNSVGTRLLGSVFLWRTIRQLRGPSGSTTGAAAAAGAGGAAVASPTQATRAPRWSRYAPGTAATYKGYTPPASGVVRP